MWTGLDQMVSTKDDNQSFGDLSEIVMRTVG